MGKIRNRFGFILMWLCALFTAAMILVIFAFLYYNAGAFFNNHSLIDFLIGLTWKPSAGEYGILPMILGSGITTVFSLSLALPLGVLLVWCLHFYIPPSWNRLVVLVVNVMSAIPSVVYGLFALTIVGPLVRNTFGGSGFSVITTVLLLSIMILPTVITLYNEELEAIGQEHYAGALALGESRERSILRCILPISSYGIFSAGILALGRAVGETMAVLMVAGNVPQIPLNFTEGVRTLTTNITLEMGYATGEHRSALVACGLVLLVIVLLLEILIFWMKRKFVHER